MLLSGIGKIWNTNKITGRKHSGPLLNSHKVWNENNPEDPVKKGEAVHHKDGNSANDTPTNLEKMKRGEHSSLHHKGKITTRETKIRQSIAAKGRSFSEETKRKMSEAAKGRKPWNLGLTTPDDIRKKQSLSKLALHKKRRELCY